MDMDLYIYLAQQIQLKPKKRVLKETIEGPYSLTKTESDAGGKWGGKFIYVYGFV